MKDRRDNELREVADVAARGELMVLILISILRPEGVPQNARDKFGEDLADFCEGWSEVLEIYKNMLGIDKDGDLPL